MHLWRAGRRAAQNLIVLLKLPHAFERFRDILALVRSLRDLDSAGFPPIFLNPVLKRGVGDSHILTDLMREHSRDHHRDCITLEFITMNPRPRLSSFQHDHPKPCDQAADLALSSPRQLRFPLGGFSRLGHKVAGGNVVRAEFTRRLDEVSTTPLE